MPKDIDSWKRIADEVSQLESGTPELFIPPDYDPDPGRGGSWEPNLGPTQKLIFHDPAPVLLAYGEKGCRTLDTMIYTDHGLIRLGKLKPENAEPGFNPIQQRVMSTQSTVDTADAYWVESSMEAYRVELSNGAEITGSPRHPIWACVQAPDGSFQFRWVKFSEMESLKSNGFRLWTPFFGHSQWDGGVEMDLDLAYALGALVGDGSLNVGGGAMIGFTNMDPECVARTDKGMQSIGCRLSQRVKSIQYSVKPRGKIFPLIQKLRLIGKSYDKRIPDEIVSGTKAVAAAFLRGLFDTDGTVEKSGLVSYCTTSEALSRDVQDLLAAFGILCVRRPKKSASGRPTWTLSLMGRNAWLFGQQIRFEIKRKQDRILKPKLSPLCPNGFNSNRYGYPDPIRSAMRQIALANRTDARKPKPGVIHRSRLWHDTHRYLHSFGSVPQRPKVEKFCELYQCADQLKEFTVSETWLEVSAISKTEAELADLRVPGQHSFLAAGTLNHNSGKSSILLDCDVRHAYENPNALVLILVTFVSAGAEGAWYDLENFILPRWRDGNRYPDWLGGAPHPRAGELMDNGIGLNFTETKLDPLTKDRHIWISTASGEWSKILLKSIPHASQVDGRIRGPAPSRVHVEEITLCDGPEYYVLPTMQLKRRRGILGPMQFTASCNPDGPSHWVYKELIEPSVREDGTKDPFYSIHHIPLEENKQFINPGYQEQLNRAIKDPYQRRRMIDGEWVDMPSGDAIFKDYFSFDIHVKGDALKGIGLLPKPGFPIIVGHDPGPKNYSIHFEQLIPTTDPDRPLVWNIFDELNFVGQYKPYDVIAKILARRVRYWLEHSRAGYPYVFQHIADEAAFTQRNTRGSFDALDMQKEAKKHGLILKMRACPKGNDTQPQRAQMVIDYLLYEMMFVSACCEKTIDMLRLIPSKKLKEGEYDPYVGLRPQKCPHLHPLDSITYPMWYHRVRPGAFATTGEVNRSGVFWAGSGG